MCARACVRACVRARVFVSLCSREREGGREGEREGERDRARARERESEAEGKRKLVCVCGLVWCTFDADPHLKHIRHRIGQRAQLEGNGAVLARGEEVVERPLPQLAALFKLLFTNVGDCRLLTHGGDGSLRHRHAVLCVFGHVFSQSDRCTCSHACAC